MPVLRHLSRQRAFTLIELLVVVLIIAILIAVAAPSFLGQQDKAHDSATKQQLTVARKAAKAIWTSEGQRGYPTLGATADAAGEDTLIGQLKGAEPQYSFVASPDAANTGDISVKNEAAHSVSLCEQSKSGTFFCLVTDERGGLTQLANATGLDALLGVENAYAAADVAYATGSTESDARCVIDVARGEGDLGDCGTGKPGWASPAAGSDVTTPAPDPESTPTPVTAPVADGAPEVSGTPRVGEQLNATAGEWKGSQAAYAYQWQRKTGTGDWADISNATTATYQVKLADVDHTLRVKVTAANGAGNATQYSAATANVDATYTDTVQTTPTLTSYWKLGDGSSPLLDTAGSRNMTAHGGVTFGATGIVAAFPTTRGITFDGSTGYTETPDHPSLSPAHFTWELWFRVSSWQKSNGRSNAGVLVYKRANYEGSNFGAYGFVVREGSGTDPGYVDFNMQDGVGAPTVKTAALALNTTYHIAATYDKQQLKLYLNGKLVDSRALTATLRTANTPLTFGHIDNEASQDYFKGTLDEVALYNSALDAGTICAHYKKGSGAGSC